jgi:hypothetical protein
MIILRPFLLDSPSCLNYSQINKKAGRLGGLEAGMLENHRSGKIQKMLNG